MKAKFGNQWLPWIVGLLGLLAQTAVTDTPLRAAVNVPPPFQAATTVLTVVPSPQATVAPTAAAATTGAAMTQFAQPSLSPSAALPTATATATSVTTITTIKDGVGIVQGIVQTLAVIVAGLWAYARFGRKRERFPRAAITHNVLLCTMINPNVCLLKLTVTIENTGETLLQLSDGDIWIQQIEPWPDEVLALPDADEQPPANEYEWPLISEQRLGASREIEPGEKDGLTCDFFLPGFVRTIQVYTYFGNKVKQEIGWPYTSVHSVPFLLAEVPIQPDLSESSAVAPSHPGRDPLRPAPPDGTYHGPPKAKPASSRPRPTKKP